MHLKDERMGNGSTMSDRLEALLSAKRVSAYSAVQEQDGITFQKAPVSQESGISIDSLDEVINKMNEIQDAIIWG